MSTENYSKPSIYYNDDKFRIEFTCALCSVSMQPTIMNCDNPNCKGEHLAFQCPKCQEKVYMAQGVRGKPPHVQAIVTPTLLWLVVRDGLDDKDLAPLRRHPPGEKNARPN